MLAKIWKKLLLFILIIACLFSIVNKLIRRNTLSKELETSAKYYSNNLNEIEKQKGNSANENIESTIQNIIK